jgi:NAD(P)-dependent dehydrogenase (short-subunit alcohol dehydrogenase family)
MGRLDGKTALITGAASGIGAATSRLFVEEGAKVLLTDIMDELGAALADELGSDAHYLHVDVSKESQVEKAVQYCVDEWGKLDVVFNNAGSGGVLGSITDITEQGMDKTIDVLFKGVFYGVKHAAIAMKKQGHGSIINNASTAGIRTGSGPHIYSACKAAVIQLTRTVASEIGKYGVRVNCVCPGGIVTPIYLRGLGYSQEVAEANLDLLGRMLGRGSHLGRCGTPMDVAKAVLWLASDDSAYVTGQPIVVSGGSTNGGLWEGFEIHFRELVEKEIKKSTNVS